MRSGELPAYLSLNQLLNGILSHSWCYSVQIWPISQKFNSCVTDGRADRPTDGRTDRRTDTPSYRDENASKNDEKKASKWKEWEKKKPSNIVIWLVRFLYSHWGAANEEAIKGPFFRVTARIFDQAEAVILTQRRRQLPSNEMNARHAVAAPRKSWDMDTLVHYGPE